MSSASNSSRLRLTGRTVEAMQRREGGLISMRGPEDSGELDEEDAIAALFQGVSSASSTRDAETHRVFSKKGSGGSDRPVSQSSL